MISAIIASIWNVFIEFRWHDEKLMKVALYFAWLGFYTNLLIVPSCVGVICFIYGLLSLSSHIPSQEICKNETTTMCPACDQGIQGRYRHRFFWLIWHQITYASIRNKHFFTKWCHHQAYQNYEQPPQILQNSDFRSPFFSIKNQPNCSDFFLWRILD